MNVLTTIKDGDIILRAEQLHRRNLVSPKATWHREPEILFYEGFRVFGVSSDGGSERCGCVG